MVLRDIAKRTSDPWRPRLELSEADFFNRHQSRYDVIKDARK